MNSKNSFKVITVSSSPKHLFDPNQHRKFFCVDYDDIYLRNLEELSKYLQADFNPLYFRSRLIPKQREVQTISIGEKSSSREVQVYTDTEQQKTFILQSDTLPENKDFQGIITDLNLRRDAIHPYVEPYGLGIVAWAVQHGFPVGLVYDDSSIESRLRNFWLESVLDTLELHPSCFENKIISGDISNVCKGMYELLKSNY